MKKLLSFVKTTLLGGLIFLLPLVLLITVIGKGVEIIMNVIEPLHLLFPGESFQKKALVYVSALFALFLICFLAGIAAKSVLGTHLFEAVDKKLMKLPGYALFKARVTGNIGSDIDERFRNPVIVTFKDHSKIGFLIETTPEGLASVYLPGTPDPWIGSFILVSKAQTKPIHLTMKETLQLFEQIGKGISTIH